MLPSNATRDNTVISKTFLQLHFQHAHYNQQGLPDPKFRVARFQILFLLSVFPLRGCDQLTFDNHKYRLRKCCSPRPGLIELQISSAVQIARKLLKKGHPGVNDGFNFMVFDWSFLMTFNWIMVELLCFGPIKTSSRPKTVTPGYRLFICIILGVLIF